MVKAHHAAVGGRSGAFVFADGAGRPIDAIAAWRHIWARIVRASGIAAPAARFHDVRHAWAVTMLRAGVRPEPLAKLGGWAEVSIIHRRYGKHALPDELEDAGRALADYRAGRRPGRKDRSMGAVPGAPGGASGAGRRGSGIIRRPAARQSAVPGRDRGAIIEFAPRSLHVDGQGSMRPNRVTPA